MPTEAQVQPEDLPVGRAEKHARKFFVSYFLEADKVPVGRLHRVETLVKKLEGPVQQGPVQVCIMDVFVLVRDQNTFTLSKDL